MIEKMSEDVLIPPPSIGASEQSNIKPKKKAMGISSGAKLWLLILACVVVGVTLGIVVYQQSVTPAPSPKTTTKPTAAPVASPVVPQVNLVTPQANSITVPKDGKLRLYVRSLTGGWKQLYFNLANNSGSADFFVPAGNATNASALSYKDTEWSVQAQETYNFIVSVTANGSDKLDGYIEVNANKCGGVNNFAAADISSYISTITSQVGTGNIISQQCWGDETVGEHDFNDYLVVWAYTPTTVAASTNPSSTPIPSSSPKVSPSPSPSPSPSLKPSPSPSVKASPSPSIKASPSPSPSLNVSPSPSVKPSPSPSPSIKASASVAASATPTPSPSPSIRAAVPEASELPSAGVFEVTAGTIGIGAVLLILGLLGLLVL